MIVIMTVYMIHNRECAAYSDMARKRMARERMAREHKAR